jgi:hypothetical protein
MKKHSEATAQNAHATPRSFAGVVVEGLTLIHSGAVTHRSPIADTTIKTARTQYRSAAHMYPRVVSQTSNPVIAVPIRENNRTSRVVAGSTRVWMSANARAATAVHVNNFKFCDTMIPRYMSCSIQRD